MPKCILLLTTSLRCLAILTLQLSAGMTLRPHHPELVEIVHFEILVL
jgi:hypothetical protein